MNTSSSPLPSTGVPVTGHVSDCSIHLLYHEFECSQDFGTFQSWCLSHSYLPVYAVVGYVIAIFAGSAFMKNRPAFDLKFPLFLWNACLALFSIIGAFRTGTELMHVLSSNGFYGSICFPSTDNVTSFWRFAFVMSKFAEVSPY